MRARNLKPSFFKNDELAELPMAARLLFQGLWCMADREGRLEDRPARIKAETLPYDDVDTNDLLQMLHDYGFIRRYTVGRARLILVSNFKKHQSPHKNEAESVLPAPEDSETSTIQAPESHPSTQPDSLVLTPDSLTADVLTVGERASAPSSSPKRPSPLAFEIAETLKQAPWVADDVTDVATAVDRSLAKFPAFNAARDGPLLAEQYANWPKYRKKPPANWYSAWLNWLKGERTDEHQATNGTGPLPRPLDRRGRSDPASQIGRDAGTTDDAWLDGLSPAHRRAVQEQLAASRNSA